MRTITSTISQPAASKMLIIETANYDESARSNAILKLPSRKFLRAVSQQITPCIQCLLVTCQKQIFESPKLYEARTRSSGEKDRAVT